MVIWYDTIRYVYGRGAQATSETRRGEARQRGGIYIIWQHNLTQIFGKKKKGKEERRRRGKGITIFDRYGERKTERTNTLSPLKRAWRRQTRQAGPLSIYTVHRPIQLRVSYGCVIECIYVFSPNKSGGRQHDGGILEDQEICCTSAYASAGTSTSSGLTSTE